MDVSLRKEVDKLFGPEDGARVPSVHIKQMLKTAWMGEMSSEALRPLCWRVLLGLLSSDKGEWVAQLDAQQEKYADLKARVMPSIDKVKVDPLSALSDGDDISDEWCAFYKNVELIQFIKGDLDRLYLSGLEEQFFQTKPMRSLMLSVLFIWACEHSYISYRQGMHEIAGILVYCVVQEQQAWASYRDGDEGAGRFSLTEPLAAAERVEAYAYWLFERVMMELEVLYDPLPVSGAENMPFIVNYCTKIQEHYLRILDPPLCLHMEEVYIQAQLYGLRWARLLLGREFTVSHSSLLRLWDFMFASCYDLESGINAHYLDEDIMPNIYSVLAAVRLQGHTKVSNLCKRSDDTSKVVYVCSPLLGALGDFMMAMMMQIRSLLLEGDQNTVMGALMRYPAEASGNVLAIIETADMIRRGVIVRDEGIREVPLQSPGHGMMRRQSSSNVSKRVTEGLSSFKTGLSDLISSMSSSTPAAAPAAGADLGYDGYGDKEGIEPAVPVPKAASPLPHPLALKATDMTDIYKDGAIVHEVNPLIARNAANAARPPAAIEAIYKPSEGIVHEDNPLHSKDVKPVVQISPLGGESLRSISSSPNPLARARAPVTPAPATPSTSASTPKPSSDRFNAMAFDDKRGFLTGKGSWFSTPKKTNKEADGLGLAVLHTTTAPGPGVGDRLQELADTMSAYAKLADGQGDVFEAMSNRLAMLVEVLGGSKSIVEYDQKFANAELPSPSAQSVQTAAAAAAAASST